MFLFVGFFAIAVFTLYSPLGGQKAQAQALSTPKEPAYEGKMPIIEMKLKTGSVLIQMRPDLAPKNVAQIVTLTKRGFYDGIVFHRVIDGFMAQAGCPQGTGVGGSDKPDLAQEFNEEKHVRGTCSMARTADPDSANSQFFICFDDTPFLDRQYTVWGQVTEGMDVIDQLERGEPVANPDKIVQMKLAVDAGE